MRDQNVFLAMQGVRRSTLILSSPTGQSKGQNRGVQRECWRSCLAKGLEEWGIWTSPWEQTFKSCWWLGYYWTAGLLCFLEPGKEKKEKTLLLLQTVLSCSFIHPFQGPGWCGIGNCLPNHEKDKARLSPKESTKSHSFRLWSTWRLSIGQDLPQK